MLRSAESVPTLAAAASGPGRPLAAPLERRRVRVPDAWPPASNQAMISSGVAGCCLSNARRFSTRWMLSAMFSHEPPTGVATGGIPWANSHRTNSGVLCPARLSSTNSIRKDGNSSGRVGLKPPARSSPPPPCRPRARAKSARGTAKAARISDNSRFSQGWSTALEQVVTPSIRTRPSVGGVERRQHLGRPVADILVWLAGGIALRPPGLPGMRHGLERTRLVAAPDRQAQRLAQTVGVLNRGFFGSASGSRP